MLARALAEGLRGLGLDVDDAAQQRLLAYVALLEKWNKVYNLTAIRDPEQMICEHLLDSLAAAPHVLAGSLLDLGSGAGLPGIPLRIVRPDLKVTLLESSRKKCAFLRQAAIELRLADLQIACERAEAYRPVEALDNVIARAFADLKRIAALGLPLLRSGGRLLALKGADPAAELAAVAPVDASASVIRLHVPGLAARRHLVIMTKA
jgi:16S rRNA (guanine527-N7)-methyltransferase